MGKKREEIREIKNGSVKELWNVSFALMISFLSMMGMVFVDRLFLARYSTEALSAASSAGNLVWAVDLAWINLAAMAEVFVAQYNGAKKYTNIGPIIWQVIWLSIFSIVFFLPLSAFGSLWFAKTGILKESGIEFFKWNTLYSPLLVFQAAFSAFFIGQGKTKIIQWLAIIGNIVNIVLDPILIFGIKGWIPSYGIAGAAFATSIGTFVQVLVLALLFLNKKHQMIFGTIKWRFQWQLFKRCMKVAISPAIFIFFELFGWAIFYFQMDQISESHIFVASVCQAFSILFLFFGLGLEKGVAAIAGNLIGSRLLDKIKNLVRSGLILIGCFATVLFAVLTLFPDQLISWFFASPNAIEGIESLDVTAMAHTPQVISALKMGLLFTGAYLTIENIRWILSGILTSSGDTFFLMITGTCSIWLFLILPTYLLITLPKSPIEYAFLIWIFYSLMSTTIVFLRYIQGKWKEKRLIDSEQTSLVTQEISFGDQETLPLTQEKDLE